MVMTYWPVVVPHLPLVSVSSGSQQYEDTKVIYTIIQQYASCIYALLIMCVIMCMLLQSFKYYLLLEVVYDS